MRTMKRSMMFAALAAAVVMSACSVNDGINDGGNQPVRFTAGIDEVATPQNAPGATRAAGTAWAASDKIGIFMVDHGTTNVSMSASNKQYETTTGSGTFSAVSGNEIYYPQTGTVHFIAYYPYVTSAALETPIDVEIATDQTAAGVQSTFDLLYSTGATGSKANGTTPVGLTFDHKLAKIVMKTVADSSIGVPLAGMTVEIKGMNTKNTFELSTGAFGTANTPAPIAPREITNGAKYEAVILPASATAALGDFYVEFTINPNMNPETFTWKMPAGTIFEGGNEYAYTVTLSRTEVTATGTITPWITTGNDRGGVTAE